jgi:hypothetical protein
MEFGFRQIERKADGTAHIQTFAGLHREAFFADVRHLTQFNGHSAFWTLEADVPGRVQFVTNAPSALADGGGDRILPDDAKFHVLNHSPGRIHINSAVKRRGDEVGTKESANLGQRYSGI